MLGGTVFCTLYGYPKISKTKTEKDDKMRTYNKPQHKTLVEMVEVASARGESKRGNWLVEYNVKGSGEYKDLGYKKEEVKIGTYRIYHWGTLILEIEEHGNLMMGYRRRVIVVYGTSVSDARGINAVLDYFGIGGTRYTYKPVNGGFQSQY